MTLTSDNRNCIPQVTECGDFIVKAGWVLDTFNTTHELVYFPKGSQTKYEARRHTFVLDEPCVVITPQGEVHRYTFDPVEPTRHLWLTFEYISGEEEQATSPLFAANGPTIIPVKESPMVQGIMKHIMFLGSQSSEPNRHERCNRLLYTLLGELEAHWSGKMEPRERIPPPLQRSIEYIDKNLANPLTIAEIAGISCWSHPYYTRVFVRYMGLSPREFVLFRRIERACQLLIQGQNSIKQIASAVGFNDTHYFSRCFIQVKGLTATQFRERFADSRLFHLSTVETHQAPYPLNRNISFE